MNQLRQRLAEVEETGAAVAEHQAAAARAQQELAEARRQLDDQAQAHRAELAKAEDEHQAAAEHAQQELAEARRRAEIKVVGVLRARLVQVEAQQAAQERGVEVTPVSAEPSTITGTKAKKRTQPRRTPRARRR